MILLIIRIHRLIPGSPIQFRHINSMIHIHHIPPFHLIRSFLRETHESRRTERIRAAFPNIIRGLGGNNDVGAAGLEEFGGIDEVGVESIDCFCDAAVNSYESLD